MEIGQEVRLNDKFDMLIGTDVVVGIKVLEWRKIFRANSGHGKIKKNLYDDFSAIHDGFCDIIFPKYPEGLTMYKMFLK